VPDRDGGNCETPDGGCDGASDDERDAAPDNEWDADAYDADVGFVHEYGESVLCLLDPKPGERVLDLGCDTGHLTAEIAGAVGPEGGAAGVDSAPDMVRQARETYPDVRFVEADARDLDTALGDERFDAVFSNAALHWVAREDQAAVAGGVRGLLPSGGRFVAELGGVGNVAAIRDAVGAELRARGYSAENPWYQRREPLVLPDRRRARRRPRRRGLGSPVRPTVRPADRPRRGVGAARLARRVR
jgi:SAM-dependent methyltransferase